MTFTRVFNVFVLFAAMTIAGHESGAAQSLSDSTQSLASSWSSGYMGLGGNLGKAIRHRASAKPIKAAKAAHADRRAANRARPVQMASFNSTEDAPMYLVVQSLDHSGLNSNTLRLRARGP